MLYIPYSEILVCKNLLFKSFQRIDEKNNRNVEGTGLGLAITEGFVREIISKVQTMRKDADFNVTDHIIITVSGSEKIEKIIENNKEFIFSTVLANDVVIGEPDGYTAEWNINGEKVNFGVKVSE